VSGVPTVGALEQLRIDRVLCQAFGKLPGESLNAAAQRCLLSPHATIRVKWAAKALLRVDGPARDVGLRPEERIEARWSAMAAAARIIEGASS
jgi:hypothetical protein